MTQLMHPFHTGPGQGPDHEPTDHEPTDPEPTDHEPTDQEPTDREPTGHEHPDQDPAAVDLVRDEAGTDAAPDTDGDTDGTTAEDAAQADLESRDTGSARRAGQTTVASEVIEKVASIAVRKVPGVHDIGAGGIAAAVTDRAATMQVALTVTYGHPVYDVADQVREDLADAVEQMLGIEVTRVDVAVDDIHLPVDPR